MAKHKIVFLYTELAEYFTNCLNQFVKHANSEVHLFRYPVNKEAPFNFSIDATIHLYTQNEDFTDNSIAKIVDDINPDIIFCSGWAHKPYVQICKHFKSKIPTVLLMDNQWEGTWKQQLLALGGKFLVRSAFNRAWVSGEPQKTYALKLGYQQSEIQTGFYVADIELFNSSYNRYLEPKRNEFPKKILYVGRYVTHKGIFDMWDAFVELVENGFSEWEMWCVGTGDQFDNKVTHPNIKHFGFIQPNEIDEYIGKCGIYILPSHFEPWGVTVQEFTAAGMPIVCSDKVGAATKFVKEGKNGYLFPSGNKDKLLVQLKKMMTLDSRQLFEMGEKSHELGNTLTPESWRNSLLSFLEE